MAILPNGGTTSHTLTGKYSRHGSKLSGPVDLLLVHRTTTTTAKASTYVLRVHTGGKREYVSSLWDGPTPGTYALEYKGIRYHLSLTDSVAVVNPTSSTSEGGTDNSNVPPVVKIDNDLKDGPTQVSTGS